jgi:hypothetical protein
VQGAHRQAVQQQHIPASEVQALAVRELEADLAALDLDQSIPPVGLDDGVDAAGSDNDQPPLESRRLRSAEQPMLWIAG